MRVCERLFHEPHPHPHGARRRRDVSEDFLITRLMSWASEGGPGAEVMEDAALALSSRDAEIARLREALALSFFGRGQYSGTRSTYHGRFPRRPHAILDVVVPGRSAKVNSQELVLSEGLTRTIKTDSGPELYQGIAFCLVTVSLVDL